MAAICSALIPPQEMPRMPTDPFDQDCLASQAMTWTPSVSSGTSYSSTMIPSEFPVPRISTRTKATP